MSRSSEDNLKPGGNGLPEQPTGKKLHGTSRRTPSLNGLDRPRRDPDSVTLEIQVFFVINGWHTLDGGFPAKWLVRNSNNESGRLPAVEYHYRVWCP